jgi:hypothetical protein
MKKAIFLTAVVAVVAVLLYHAQQNTKEPPPKSGNLTDPGRVLGAWDEIRAQALKSETAFQNGQARQTLVFFPKGRARQSVQVSYVEGELERNIKFLPKGQEEELFSMFQQAARHLSGETPYTLRDSIRMNERIREFANTAPNGYYFFDLLSKPLQSLKMA